MAEGAPVCSNYGLDHSAEDIADQFVVVSPFTVPQPANYFPKQLISVIGRKPGSTARGLIAVKWGLLPNDYPSPDQQPQPFNARSESIDWVGIFQESFRERRCLIPADHFFEWTKARPKVRYRLGLAGGGLFAFAGLWDRWTGPAARPILSATIATTKPNELIGAFHDRMPVILRPEAYDLWLDNKTPAAELKKLLMPFPAGEMICVAAPRS